jgi:hypothetical protein
MSMIFQPYNKEEDQESSEKDTEEGSEEDVEVVDEIAEGAEVKKRYKVALANFFGFLFLFKFFVF